MADLKIKYDTAFNILTTGINSLAASTTAGFAAAEIDNTTNLYDDVWIVGQFAWTTGTATGFMEMYGLSSNDGTIYSGDTSYSGSAAAYTLAAVGSANMGVPVLCQTIAQSTTRQVGFSLASLFGGRVPPFWSLVVVNNSGGAALASSGSTVTGRGIWYQSVQAVPLVLNRSSPLAAGLVFCVAGGQPAELVAGGKPTYGGTVSSALAGRTRWGKAFEANVTNGTEWIAWADTFLAGKITTKHTVIAIVDVDTRTTFAPFLSIPYTDGSWGSPFVSIFFGVSSSNGFLNWQWTVGGSRSEASVAGMVAGAHVFSWTRNDNAHVVAVDGASVYNSTSGSSGTIDFGGDATTAVIHGRSSTSTGESNDGRTYLVGLWNRVLTPGEVNLIRTMPGLLFTRAESLFPLLASPSAPAARRRTGLYTVT